MLTFEAVRDQVFQFVSSIWQTNGFSSAWAGCSLKKSPHCLSSREAAILLARMGETMSQHALWLSACCHPSGCWETCSASSAAHVASHKILDNYCCIVVWWVGEITELLSAVSSPPPKPVYQILPLKVLFHPKSNKHIYFKLHLLLQCLINGKNSQR